MNIQNKKEVLNGTNSIERILIATKILWQHNRQEVFKWWFYPNHWWTDCDLLAMFCNVRSYDCKIH